MRLREKKADPKKKHLKKLRAICEPDENLRISCNLFSVIIIACG
jgi:hypothetical protein